MTEPRIRELLTELAEPIDGRDLAELAWRDAGRRLLRVRFGVLATVAVVALGAVGVGWAASHETNRPGAGSSGGGATAILLTQAGPTPAAEKALPAVRIGMPQRLRIDTAAPWIAAAPIRTAVAAFAVSGTASPTLVLVTATGVQRRLDISGVQPPAGSSTDPAAAFTPGSLSPDGTRLAFRVADGIAIYTLATGEWSTPARWLVTGTSGTGPLQWYSNDSLGYVGDVIVVLGPDSSAGQVRTVQVSTQLAGIGGTSLYGPRRATDTYVAQSATLNNPDSDVGRGILTSQAVIVQRQGDPVGTRALLFADAGRDAEGTAVAGWSGMRDVVYESRSGAESSGQVTRLVAWDFAAGTLRLGATITAGPNTTFVGSYADLAS